jgi:hypothetical protein
MSAMFASMVIQNTNMAMIFLGRSPNPQTGKTELDLDNARYFIDQLEMLALKTKGNLDRNEDGLLKQSLTTLRLAFVEVVNTAASSPAAELPSADPSAGARPANEPPPTDEQETPSAETPPEGEPAGEAAPIIPPEAESKKKFTKKY